MKLLTTKDTKDTNDTNESQKAQYEPLAIQIQSLQGLGAISKTRSC